MIEGHHLSDEDDNSLLVGSEQFSSEIVRAYGCVIPDKELLLREVFQDIFIRNATSTNAATRGSLHKKRGASFARSPSNMPYDRSWDQKLVLMFDGVVSSLS